MAGAVGVVTLLVVLGLSLVITRLAAVALTYTGLSSEAARFQARSAFTGTGFTTSEAERVVDHPLRRRIVTLLMVVRSAGLVTIVTSLMLSFAGTGSGADRLQRLLWLFAGVLVLWVVANTGPVDRALRRAIRWGLERWTDLDVRDYAGLLKLSGDYAVSELAVREGDWLAGKELGDCQLTEEGVTVLGIYRQSGDYLGVPQASTGIRAGDTLILYGRQSALEELDTRRDDPSGDRAHRQAKADQEREVAEQEARDE
ncbi:MAG TPA: TrkA C-terminal domain-containing protein [Candidatus Sulfomarinibacteraceae bacterium]|nr:TrkA C-terminal domain-containing protein [Candidatus Sulfomarinibacteraceae bacterium]